MNLGDDEKAPHIPEGLALEDKWILSLYNDLVKDVTDSLEKYELGMAVQKLYDFIWDVFCDWYIELSKIRLGGDDEKAKETAKSGARICYVKYAEALASVYAVYNRGDMADPSARRRYDNAVTLG